MKHPIDKENMLGVLDNFHKQCEEAFKLGKKIKITGRIDSIIVAGMGGSALSGDILKSYLNLSIPIHVCRDYHLPKWASKNTLVFSVSYSGNTEETIHCFREAKRIGCTIIAITAGGKLKEIAEKSNVPLVLVPRGIQPRDAVGYLTIPILNILQNSYIIRDVSDDIKETIRALKKDFKPTAQEMAKKAVDKIPIIYSSSRLYVLSRIWKIKVNENAKVQAFHDEFPELNHNEMLGFTNPKGEYLIIMLKDEDDFYRVKKRMDVTKEKLQKIGYKVIEIKIKGKSMLSRIFTTILLGSYFGYYLALEYGTDPSPVDMVEDFKKDLGPFVGR
jgi:glucose/mannose-6-phosphate isomerase